MNDLRSKQRFNHISRLKMFRGSLACRGVEDKSLKEVDNIKRLLLLLMSVITNSTAKSFDKGT